MDPLIGSSLISAGSSLLGGLFGGKTKNVSAADNIISLARGVRLASEEQGFNPLTLLGASGGMGGYSYQAGNPAMGQAISDAGLLLAQGMEKRQEKIALEAEKKKNEELQRKVTNLTIRPKVGGIYAQTETTPTLLGALGRGSVDKASGVSDEGVSFDGRPPASSSRDVRPLTSVDEGSYVSDPRRNVEADKVKSHPGYIMLDNPNLPVPLRVPTLDGDEALQWYDYPSLIVPGVLAGLDFLNSPAFGPQEGYASDGEPLRDPIKPKQVFGPPMPRKKRKPKKKSQHPLKGLGF